MTAQINEYVNIYNILCDVQLGFIKGRSCMTALTDVMENLRADLDNNMICILVLLVHDTVDHSIFKKKNWINFSASRKQLVEYYVHILQVDLRLFLILEHVLKALMLIGASHRA